MPKIVFQNVHSASFLIYLESPVGPDRRALTSQYYGLKDQPLNSHREPKYLKKHTHSSKIIQNQGVGGQNFADFLGFPSNSLTSTCQWQPLLYPCSGIPHFDICWLGPCRTLFLQLRVQLNLSFPLHPQGSRSRFPGPKGGEGEDGRHGCARHVKLGPFKT